MMLFINAMPLGKKIKIANKQKNVIVDIIFTFVNLDIVPVSRYDLAPDAKYLLLINQLYNRGDDLVKDHNAIRMKTVVGSPGTNMPIVPRITQRIPKPIQHIRFIFRINIISIMSFQFLI